MQCRSDACKILGKAEVGTFLKINFILIIHIEGVSRKSDKQSRQHQTTIIIMKKNLFLCVVVAIAATMGLKAQVFVGGG